QIDLTWKHDLNPVQEPPGTGFELQRKTGAEGTYETIATLGLVTSYQDTPLSPTTTYYYRVSAYHTVGEDKVQYSNWSNEAFATTDSTFGTNGFVVHSNTAGGNGDGEGRAITTDANGKILVTGWSKNVAGNNDMVIWRYNSDGTLDTTFDTDGTVIHNGAAGGNGYDGGYSIAVNTNGKILITGHSQNTAGNNDMVIWRYNSDGTLDTTFDTDGIVVHHNAAGGDAEDWGNSITIDINGKILVTGVSRNASGNNDMAIWRYNPDGTLDTTFGGGNGFIVHHNAAGGNSEDSGWGITIDTNDKILVTGESFLPGPYNPAMVIWRYNSDGTLDTTFDTDGIIIQDSVAGGDESDSGYAIVIDSNDKILVAGCSENAASNNDMIIWRYNA
ncbi:unnamed protein product, partial [marine sediment metagenome]